MSTDIVKYAFIAGEISPKLFGRTDLTKYDLGVAEAKNFWVDYRGGLSTRPGTRFVDFIKEDDKEVRSVPFSFSPDEEDTYLVLFGESYIRFIQSGAYVLEADITITGITQASPAVVTAAGHGLAAGRWVKISGVSGMTEINGRTFEVRNPTTNTFELYEVPSITQYNSNSNSGYVSGGVASPIYEIASPYAATDLTKLNFDQYRDVLRITSEDFAVRTLTRSGHTSWAIAEADISPYSSGPTISGHTESDTGDAETLFAVTSVDANGVESGIGNIYKATTMVNYPVTEGSVSITWAADSDAVYYNVYRSVISVSETLTYGSELGYAGKTFGTKFTDPNIVPDFGRTPPQNYNPFSPGAILSISISTGGTGYTSSSTVSVSGGSGTGFEGRVVVNDSGAIVNVIIENAGEGYESPTVSFSGGTGAAATATARANTGTYPALSKIFQQRQVYAASIISPVTIWGSQYKQFDNFNSSDIVLDTDSYEFDLDTNAIAPIRHLIVTRGGLLSMTQDNVWLMNGGNSGKALTPTSVLADPQTYTGVSLLEPIRIDSDILYVEGKGYAVRMLSYNEISRIYASEDKSILSNHFFSEGKRIKAWAYQESPYKTVWAVREDGKLLAFTIVKSEDVYAWTLCETKGRYTDVVSVCEGSRDRIYLTSERYIRGRWTKYVEQLDFRQFMNVEDAWCVDAGLDLTLESPAANITVIKVNDEGLYLLQADADVFNGALNKVVRGADGIFEIKQVLTDRQVYCSLIQDITEWVPETDNSLSFPLLSGTWTLADKITTVSGLWHLEGETVSILADGNVQAQQTVVNGSITLTNPSSYLIVGLPFTCRAKTLPLIVPDAGIEAKRKRIPGLAVRLSATRGLSFGDSYDNLYEMRERRSEDYGRPINLLEGIYSQPIGSRWDDEGQTYFELTDPLPCTLLSLVQDVEIGDEPD